MNLSKQHKSLHSRGSNSVRNVSHLTVTIGLIPRGAKLHQSQCFLLLPAVLFAQSLLSEQLGRKSPFLGLHKSRQLVRATSPCGEEQYEFREDLCLAKGRVQLLHASFNSINEKSSWQKISPHTGKGLVRFPLVTVKCKHQSQPQTRLLCHWLNPSAFHCTDLQGSMDQNSFTCLHTCFGYHSWEQKCRSLTAWLCFTHQVPHSATLHQQLTTWAEAVPSSATHPGASNCSAEMCFTLSQFPHPPLTPAPAYRFELHTLKSVVDSASRKQVTHAYLHPWLWWWFFPAQVCHWGTGRTQRKEKLKQTSHDMLIRVGTFRAFAIFTDITLRRTEAHLRLQGTPCCSELERKDAIFQSHCLWNCAFSDTLTKWNMLYPRKYWGSLQMHQR